MRPLGRDWAALCQVSPNELGELVSEDRIFSCLESGKFGVEGSGARVLPPDVNHAALPSSQAAPGSGTPRLPGSVPTVWRLRMLPQALGFLDVLHLRAEVPESLEWPAHSTLKSTPSSHPSGRRCQRFNRLQ
jgi:hypothetical protein